ncbi:hypothetical protein Barb4_04471 [Bacteroidales bacterium Barb4]|nr:hypothetical protein Barb4_04471 [Bacteroidales bacterium Barb4]
MVVDKDDVIGKRGLLAGGRAEGIPDGTYTVADGDNNRGFYCKGFPVKVNLLELRRKICPRLPQMIGAGCFHFHLRFAIPGIHIVKLLFTRFPCVGLYCRI